MIVSCLFLRYIFLMCLLLILSHTILFHQLTRIVSIIRIVNHFVIINNFIHSFYLLVINNYFLWLDHTILYQQCLILKMHSYYAYRSSRIIARVSYLPYLACNVSTPLKDFFSMSFTNCLRVKAPM